MNPVILAIVCVTFVFLSACTSGPQPPAGRASVSPDFWLDLANGQEVSDQDLFSDLTTAGAIFVGESHSNPRHHEVQLWLLQELFTRWLPLVLCLEQLETRDQPAVDRYIRREIDFTALAREIDWTEKWSNYADYRPLCEFARQHRIPLRALNAPAGIIRAISRGGGIARLPPDQRAQLPDEIVVDHPVAYSATGNLSRSEDLAQDTFVTAWQRLPKLREPSKLRAWLCGIARNLTSNAQRRAGREPAQLAEPFSATHEPIAPEASPSEQTVSREEEAILWRALEKIPETYREPLVLYYREHRSVANVAQALEAWSWGIIDGVTTNPTPRGTFRLARLLIRRHDAVS